MKDLLLSWLLSTSLLVFLIAGALALPELQQGLLGDTRQELTEAVDQFTGDMAVVWGQLTP